MQHHLEDIFEVCSNYGRAWEENVRGRGHMFYICLHRDNLKISSSL